MKTNVKNIVIGLIFCMSYKGGLAVFCQEQEVFRKEIDHFLQELDTVFPAKDWKFKSTIPPYWKLDSYKRLLTHGPEILPILCEYDDPDNFHKQSSRGMAGIFGLGTIYQTVTMCSDWPEHDPWCGETIATRWYGGQELAKERFDLLYVKLTSAKNENNLAQIEWIEQILADRGIYSLSFLMGKYNEGDTSMLAIVRKMFKKDFKGEDKGFLEWWSVNQERYRLPPQDKMKFRYEPAYTTISPFREYSIKERVEILYTEEWQERHFLVDGNPGPRNCYLKRIELAQLIGYENTPQFHFLVDLGEESLSYLFLKLKEEKTRFTLPVIEKIMDKKLTEEEIEQHIHEAEKLLNPPPPIVMREWTSTNGRFSIEAKYLSSTAANVTLEKANGSTVTVDLAKLSQADRDYVKRLQDAEQDKETP